MCLWESKKAFRKALAVSVSETPASFSNILAKCVICYLCPLVTALANRHSHGHASPFWSALPRPLWPLTALNGFYAATNPTVLTRGFQLWEMCPVPCLTPAPE